MPGPAALAMRPRLCARALAGSKPDAIVAGHHCGDLVAERLCGRQVAGVEAPQDSPVERGRGVEEFVVELEHVQAATEQPARPCHRRGAVRPDRSHHLHPGQRAEERLLPAGNPVSGRFRFAEWCGDIVLQG
jgi:hypothetical protein